MERPINHSLLRLRCLDVHYTGRMDGVTGAVAHFARPVRRAIALDEKERYFAFACRSMNGNGR